MYTVGEALELEVFKGCKVVGGHQGLNRPIRWAHSIDVPDAPNWLRGGELVLTTAIALAKDSMARREFVRALNKKNAAGLLISVGAFIDHVPEEMIEIADELALPIIEAPWELHLVDVSQLVNSRIVNQQFILLERSSRIHQRLTELVLQGGGFVELAQTLAELVERGVSIETPDFRLLAFAEWGLTDQARQESISQMRTPAKLIEKLEQRGDLAQLRTARRPIHIAPMPEVGMTLERIVAPIMVGGQNYGYTWLIANSRPLGELDRMAIESAATIAALILLRQQAIEETENRLKGDFLIRLLQGDLDESVLLYTSRQFNLNFDKPHQVFVLGRGSACQLSLSDLMRNFKAGVREQNILMSILGNEIVAVAEHKEPEIRTLLSQLIAPYPDLWGGIGQPNRNPLKLRLSYNQAHEAMEIARLLKPVQRFLAFEELGYLHLLYKVPLEEIEHYSFAQKLKPLLTDPRHHELLITLETYLQLGGNALATARQLHIHRSTLLYRLKRIETLCGVDLSDINMHTDLRISIQLFRLRPQR